MKLGTVTYNLAKDWDLDKIIAMCTKTGFEGVELRTTHAHGVEVDLNPEERKEVKKKFADSDVELVGLGTAFEYHALDQKVVKKNIEGTKEYVILAQDVGARGIKVRPNGDQVKNGIPKFKTFQQIGTALRECGEFALDYGVEIRLEMHGSVADAFDMAQIMEAADHKNVFICWNSNNIDVKNGSIAGDFALMKDKIRQVHITELWEHAYGIYPYPELFSLLKGVGFNGYCLAEIPYSCEPERIMKYYKALFEAYQK